MRRALLVVFLVVVVSVATLAPETGASPTDWPGPVAASSPPAVPGIRSDFNGDGVADLAIGTPGSDEAGVEGAGAVNVLYGTAASGLQAIDPADQRWTQSGDEIEGDMEAGERFGPPSPRETSAETGSPTWPSAFRTRTSPGTRTPAR